MKAKDLKNKNKNKKGRSEAYVGFFIVDFVVSWYNLNKSKMFLYFLAQSEKKFNIERGVTALDGEVTPLSLLKSIADGARKCRNIFE